MLCDVTRARAAALVADGAVLLDGVAATTRSRRVEAGQHLQGTVDTAAAAGEPLEPEPSVEGSVGDADAAVIGGGKPAGPRGRPGGGKPPGLVVHRGAGNRTGTMVQGLLARFPDLAGVGERERPGIVHRLDAGTSGLLVVARTPEAYASLVAQLAARTVERRYLALVWG